MTQENKQCRKNFFGRMIHSGRYTEWQTTEKHEIEDDNGDLTGFLLIQERTCLNCKFVEVHKKIVKYNNDSV